MFGDLDDFHFDDGHTFDFRGEDVRSANNRGGTPSDSNQRASKAFGTPSRSLRPTVGASVNTNSTGFS
jgi:hypothetical protein